MLTKRIIACLDVDAGRVVKGTRFVELRDAGDPAELAVVHAESGADEIVLLDITATHEKRTTLLDTVRRTARQLFIPFTVGGGIGSLDEACAVFDAGADKLAINSAAIRTPELIGQIAQRFGSQAVVVSVDAKFVGPSSSPGADRHEVFTHGGRKPTGRAVLDWVRTAEQCGAGEILLTSMDRDGTRSGFDCALTAAVEAAISIPVIASGGAGSVQHFVDVFRHGRADAALAASIFHFGLHDIGELKQQLAAASIPVRWPC
jgi:imidazole glycerol-phosphate synthase subunit HisF